VGLGDSAVDSHARAAGKSWCIVAQPAQALAAGGGREGGVPGGAGGGGGGEGGGGGAWLGLRGGGGWKPWKAGGRVETGQAKGPLKPVPKVPTQHPQLVHFGLRQGDWIFGLKHHGPV
jgi:hypothetical protein